MAGKRRGAPGRGEDFTYVNRAVKYLLFIFNFIFWVSASTYFQFLWVFFFYFDFFLDMVFYVALKIFWFWFRRHSTFYTVCLIYLLTLAFCKKVKQCPLNRWAFVCCKVISLFTRQESVVLSRNCRKVNLFVSALNTLLPLSFRPTLTLNSSACWWFTLH